MRAVGAVHPFMQKDNAPPLSAQINYETVNRYFCISFAVRESAVVVNSVSISCEDGLKRIKTKTNSRCNLNLLISSFEHKISYVNTSTDGYSSVCFCSYKGRCN
jgi:hypothetical protein